MCFDGLVEEALFSAFLREVCGWERLNHGIGYSVITLCSL